jgi:hypothetical protein
MAPAQRPSTRSLSCCCRVSVHDSWIQPEAHAIRGRALAVPAEHGIPAKVIGPAQPEGTSITILPRA